MYSLPSQTYSEISSSLAKSSTRTIAILPVGAFEQHGDALPMATDSLIAALFAHTIAQKHSCLELPVVTVSCSHEHCRFRGSVSVRPETLCQIIRDIWQSLQEQNIDRLLIINAHGGNYVLHNLVQEFNVSSPRVHLFPLKKDWMFAREVAGMVTNNHDDMHAGELETSLLLSYYPELVQEQKIAQEPVLTEREYLLFRGMDAYTSSGVVGVPSLATAEKGEKFLAALVQQSTSYISDLRM